MSPDPPSPKAAADKVQALRETGTFNARAAKVRDQLFQQREFFDPRDLTQVKYEMLRRVQKDEMSVAAVASSFGFSRPAFYKAQRDFTHAGMVGLIPRRRGPKGGYKLTPDILTFVEQIRTQEPSLGTAELVRRIQERFAVQVHRRTLERGLMAAKKKPPTP